LIAPGMKTIDDAMELRRRVYGALEIAENLSDPALQRFWMTFVIVGGGPTGVELAGQIRELAFRSLKKNFRRIDTKKVRVILVDGGKEPLATFGGELSGRASTQLEKMGVELRMGRRVVGVDPFGVDTETADGEKGRYECGTVIWAAGVQASPLAGMLAEATGAETDRAGRIAVLPDLTLPGHPEVFAVGDMASLDDLPGVCEVAMQGGLHAANTIKRRMKGGDSVPFKYRDLGSAAAIGRFKAMVSVRGLRLSGFPGWVVWMFVHLTFLNGFGNRFTALWRWGRSMVGRARPERVFSVGHTGGDLSLPDEVKIKVMPKAFPVLEDQLGWADLVARIGTPAPQRGEAEGSGGTVPT
jgi:NADH dehydrogenase